MFLLYAFACVFVYKLLHNLVSFLKARHFLSRYNNWLVGKDDAFSTYTQSIKKLFKISGISSPVIGGTMDAGYGQVHSVVVNVVDNIFMRRSDVISLVNAMFDNCIGAYRLRALEAFSPFYWINAILFMPKHLISYLGLDTDGAAAKLLSITLSAIWWLAMALLAVFGNEWKQFTINLISQIP